MSLGNFSLSFKKTGLILKKKISFVLGKLKEIFKTSYQNIILFRRAFWFLIVFGVIFLLRLFLNLFTETVPVPGGIYTEGVIGQPKFLNPIFAESSVDFDISYLIFSSLLKEKDKNFVGDLAESWEVSPDFKIYKIILKDNIFWHDGQKVTASDVIFTINLLNDPNYSGLFKGKFKNVAIKKIDDRTIQFTLKEPSALFLKNLTFGILPEHILGNMSFPKIIASSFNFNPVGTGPYKFTKSEVSEFGFIKSITLEVNESWHFSKPYIKTIVFKFYSGADDLLEAYKKREIMGISEIPLNLYKEAKKFSGLNIYRFSSPRYIGIFFNLDQRDEPTSFFEVRQALFYALDRDKIIKELEIPFDIKENYYLFNSYLNDIKGFEYKYNPQKAKEILNNLGWVDNNNDGILEKNDKVLKISLTISEDPQVYFFAEKVASAWKEIGVDTEIQILDSYNLSQAISEGSYKVIIQGVNLGWQFDPYYWWHSSQCGRGNLSCFKDNNIDKILTESQKITDSSKRLNNYKIVFENLKQKLPVIPLISVDLYYGVDKNLRGIEEKYISYPYQRFSDIENWYIDYIRVLKKFSLPGWRNW